MLTDKRIGVLMGGTSAEREVSIKSGTAVFNALKGLGYDVKAIEIAAEKDLHPELRIQNSEFVCCSSSQFCETLRAENIDIAFLVLHGGYGENGAIQGLLEVIGVPYTGSGVLASALAMDKEMSKKIFLYHRVPVLPFKVITAGGRENEAEAYGFLDTGFSLPWVVKPVAEGSSIGISIVRDSASLQPAVEAAFRFCGRVLVEKFLEGREVHIGVLNNRVLGSVEIKPKTGFYSYEAKYTPGLTEYILPPDMPSGIISRAEEAALSACMALGCSGAARVDLIINEQGEPYVLEVNTIPGMTETSLLPKIAKQSGLDFPSLIEEILRELIARSPGI